LAQAWSQQGQTLRAIRAEAEARAAQHDVSGAVDRLRSAQDMARTLAGADHVELSIIDTRMRQLQQQMRETALEKDF
jgi:predicted Zn-dependent protease